MPEDNYKPMNPTRKGLNKIGVIHRGWIGVKRIENRTPNKKGLILPHPFVTIFLFGIIGFF